MNFNSNYMAGDTAHMYGANKNPALYVPYYQDQLEKAQKVSADKFKHRKFLKTERIPTMSSTTITIQKADLIQGAGRGINPLTLGSINDLTDDKTNGAILDMNTTESKNPVITQRTAFRMKLHLNGLWAQVNDVAEVVERESTLKQLVTQLPYAMEETKDIYARNFMIMASTKAYVGGATSTEQVVNLSHGYKADGSPGGSADEQLANKKSSQLTLAQAIAGGISFEKNEIYRPDTDKKDTDATNYYARKTAGMSKHPAPILGFESDEGRYKLLLSNEAYLQLMADELFVEYWITGKTFDKKYGPETNSVSLYDHGGWDSFFNIRLVKVPNSFRYVASGKASLSITSTIDTAILLPQGTFAKVEIADNTGGGMYIYRFEGGVFDALKRAAAVGLKWWDGIGVATDQVPAITFIFAINVTTPPVKDGKLKNYQDNMGPFQKDDITAPMDPPVTGDPA